MSKAWDLLNEVRERIREKAEINRRHKEELCGYTKRARQAFDAAKDVLAKGRDSGLILGSDMLIPEFDGDELYNVRLIEGIFAFEIVLPEDQAADQGDLAAKAEARDDAQKWPVMKDDRPEDQELQIVLPGEAAGEIEDEDDDDLSAFRGDGTYGERPGRTLG